MRQCMDAENLHRRLRKIIGQVQAIDRMVDEDVPCEDILSQINAAKSALHRELHQGRGALLKYGLTPCPRPLTRRGGRSILYLYPHRYTKGGCLWTGWRPCLSGAE